MISNKRIKLLEETLGLTYIKAGKDEDGYKYDAHYCGSNPEVEELSKLLREAGRLIEKTLDKPEGFLIGNPYKGKMSDKLYYFLHPLTCGIGTAEPTSKFEVTVSDDGSVGLGNVSFNNPVQE